MNLPQRLEEMKGEFRTRAFMGEAMEDYTYDEISEWWLARFDSLLKEVLESCLPEEKEENKALSDGTNKEIEFLFRRRDIGMVAEHYRKVGFNSAIAKMRNNFKNYKAGK